MDGPSKTDTQIPLAMNLAREAYLEAASQSQAGQDYVAFTSNKQPADVSAYHTADRMTAAGWNNQDAPGCVYDTSAVTSAGAFCIFDPVGHSGTATPSRSLGRCPDEERGT
jgi:hypothetical protein